MKLPQIIFQFSNSHLITDDLPILKGLLNEIKAFSAQPTEVGVGLSWAELGNKEEIFKLRAQGCSEVQEACAVLGFAQWVGKYGSLGFCCFLCT